MARPKGRNGEPVRLYLNKETRSNGEKLAFNRNKSLSDLVEELIEREWAANKRNVRRRELRQQRQQAEPVRVALP